MVRERVILYTWQDVENYLFSIKNKWPSEWIKIDVFSTEIVIYSKKVDRKLEEKTCQFFSEYLKGYYVNDKLEIPMTNIELVISYEESEEEKQEAKPFPLFRDFSYVNLENKEQLPALKGAQVLAFHSYKGGVGRTLSLITFVRTMIEQYGTQKKVLIVDGTIEISELTWLGQEQYGSYEFSFIDLLNIISAKGIDDDIYEEISHVLENSFLRFHDGKLDVEQFFMPTYRNENQLMDIYSKPERIMAGDRNKYVITDALSKLGYFLKADMVLVDLRAGISDYSAPLLFDPRVRKIIVTSTSHQSIVGTSLILKQLKKQKDNQILNILLTMVNERIVNQNEMNWIYQKLLQDINVISIDDDVENIENLDEICDTLNLSENVTNVYKSIMEEIFMNS